MQPKKSPLLIEICLLGLELLIWLVCMLGPIVLVGQFTLLALLGAMTAIALFTSTFFRSRSGYEMLPGCLGLNLIFINTATVCIGFNLLAEQSQAGTLVRIAAGASGIPAVAIWIWIVGSVLDACLGPTNTLTQQPVHQKQENG